MSSLCSVLWAPCVSPDSFMGTCVVINTCGVGPGPCVWVSNIHWSGTLPSCSRPFSDGPHPPREMEGVCVHFVGVGAHVHPHVFYWCWQRNIRREERTPQQPLSSDHLLLKQLKATEIERKEFGVSIEVEKWLGSKMWFRNGDFTLSSFSWPTRACGCSWGASFRDLDANKCGQFEGVSRIT